MTWQVVFEPPAQAEIAEAFAWYEEKSYGLGGDFLRVIAAAAEQLSRNPEAFPPTQVRFRRIFLRRFRQRNGGIQRLLEKFFENGGVALV